MASILCFPYIRILCFPHIRNLAWSLRGEHNREVEVVDLKERVGELERSLVDLKMVVLRWVEERVEKGLDEVLESSKNIVKVPETWEKLVASVLKAAIVDETWKKLVASVLGLREMKRPQLWRP